MIDKAEFKKYIDLAKMAIYDKKSVGELAKLMETPQGAVVAVQTVLGSMEQATDIPPEIGIRLAPVIYLLLVDLLSEATKRKPSPEIMQKVMMSINQTVASTYKKASTQNQPDPGLIGEAMGEPA
jgi:hypothetical protein